MQFGLRTHSRCASKNTWRILRGPRPGSLLRVLEALSCAALLLGWSGCTTHSVTGFDRARSIQQEHMEIGASVSMARLPAEGARVVVDDKGSEGEPAFGFPAAALHYRLGVTERLDAGLEAAAGGIKLHAKYGILDEDRLMMAMAGTIGFWTARGGEPADDHFDAYSSLQIAFHLPLATRLRPWLELNLCPTISLMQIHAQRDAYLGTQERDFMTLHSGFRLGLNLAVWRVRINPEIAFLGVYRSDRSEGFFGVYPGLGAFLVY